MTNAVHTVHVSVSVLTRYFSDVASNNIAARIAIMAMTVNNSIKVKPPPEIEREKRPSGDGGWLTQFSSAGNIDTYWPPRCVCYQIYIKM